MQVRCKQRERAFSLVEVSIAIAIVAIAAVTLISALNQSMVARSDTVTLEEGTRIEPFVRSKLHELNFDSLYSFLKENKGSEAYHVYSYSGQLDQRRADDNSPVPGRDEDSALVLGFRKSDDEFFKIDLDFREGEAFKIRLSPFSFDPTVLNFELPGDPGDFKSSALPVFVEIFQDPVPGENIDEWLMYRRQLSFPVLISRR